MKKKYSSTASKVFLLSISIGLVSQATLALVKYIMNYQVYALIDGTVVLLLGVSILVLYLYSKDILFAAAQFYFNIFMGFSILMTFLYMLGFVDDFKSIIIGLSYVINILVVILSMYKLGKKNDCLNEMLGRKN